MALVRSPRSANVLPLQVESVVGDVTDKASVAEAMAGADGVFHLAGWYRIGVDDEATAERVNVDGTRNVLEQMGELDVQEGVYTSTLAVYSDTHGRCPDDSYRYDGPHLSVDDRTKWRAHYEVATPMVEAGLPLVIFMPGAVYAPGDRGPTWMFWGSYLRGELPVTPRGAGYCWGHVEDTPSALLRAMDVGEPRESYIVAGEPYTLVEVFVPAERLTGLPAPRAIPPAAFRALARIVAPLESLVTIPPQCTAEALRVLGGVTYWGDNAKTTREFGLDHRPLEDGLRETLRDELEQLQN